MAKLINIGFDQNKTYLDDSNVVFYKHNNKNNTKSLEDIVFGNLEVESRTWDAVIERGKKQWKRLM